MVLVMVRGEAGPHERQLKALKGELEHNSRKTKDKGPSQKTGIVTA
jgi:hypothetical protein